VTIVLHKNPESLGTHEYTPNQKGVCECVFVCECVYTCKETVCERRGRVLKRAGGREGGREGEQDNVSTIPSK